MRPKVITSLGVWESRAGGDVVLFIKNNTPVTRADLELFFEDGEADRRTWQTFEQVEKGHGRRERRQIITSPDRNRLSRARLGRGGAGLSLATGTDQQRQAQRRSGLWLDKPATQALFCSRTLAADPRPLERGKSAPLAAGCHGWSEDHCGVRFPLVAQMLAVLNTVVLSLMDAHHVANVARQIRRFASHPDEALAWLL
jgi:hypothetical protein